jgi:hypothetical protein
MSDRSRAIRYEGVDCVATSGDCRLRLVALQQARPRLEPWKYPQAGSIVAGACPALSAGTGEAKQMTLTSLQALTWSTVTGAVISALLLASGEPGLPDLSRLKRADPPANTAAALQSADSKQRAAPAVGATVNSAKTAAVR